MGNRAIMVRLSFPAGLDSHAQLDETQLYTRLVLARATGEYLRQSRPDLAPKMVTGYDSVCLSFDPAHDSQKQLQAWLLELGVSPDFGGYLTKYMQAGEGANQRLHRVPVVYGGEYGPDLVEVAQLKNLSVAEVIRLHSAATYSVYLVGFSAGYGYMGALPAALDLPRRSSPRAKVPRGTVALAAGMTGVYPLDMPGGWRLIGYTPLSVFEAELDPPVRFLPGDKVQFYPIEAEEVARFENVARDLKSSLEPQNG